MERNRREVDGRGKDRARERERERVERRGKMSRVHSLVPWCDSSKCTCVGRC